MRRILFVLATCVMLGCGDDPVTPDPPQLVIDSPEKVIEALVLAYETRDHDLLVSLLANDSDRNADFLFILSEPTEDGETQWGIATEAWLHVPMFCPTCPSLEHPVPDDLRLEAVNINLNQQAVFTERTNLYSSDGGEDGLLDPDIWKAWTTTYSTDVFFAMAGELDYQVSGYSAFVVIEDLAKSGSEPGRFLLFIWEDLGASVTRVRSERYDWSQIKDLYRRY